MFVKDISVLIGLFILIQNITIQSCKSCNCICQPTIENDDTTLSRILRDLAIRPKITQIPICKSRLCGTCPKCASSLRRTSNSKGKSVSTKLNVGAAAAAAEHMLSQLTPYTVTPSAIGPNFQIIDVCPAYEKACPNINPPADAVSLAIAYKTYQNKLKKKIFEDGLAYGFRKLPLETHKPEPPSKPIDSEVLLYTFNGNIVELKPVPELVTEDSLSTEALEELADLTCDVEINVKDDKGPSLFELGYEPVKSTSPNFINISPESYPSILPEVKE